MEQSDYETYLEELYPMTLAGAADARISDWEERRRRLSAFPHSVVLKVSYPEMDYANRWCWQQFGCARGECHQAQSDYSACQLQNPHSHYGKWQTEWLAKTDYNFGFNEWSFNQSVNLDLFMEFVPQINWGDRYPK
jgi:hypothetical protein